MLDKKLFNHVLTTIEHFAADAAANEQNAGRLLREPFGPTAHEVWGPRLPNLRISCVRFALPNTADLSASIGILFVGDVCPM